MSDLVEEVRSMIQNPAWTDGGRSLSKSIISLIEEDVVERVEVRMDQAYKSMPAPKTPYDKGYVAAYKHFIKAIRSPRKGGE